VDETLASKPAVPTNPGMPGETPSPDEQVLAGAAPALPMLPGVPAPPACMVTTTSVSVSCVLAPVAKIPYRDSPALTAAAGLLSTVSVERVDEPLLLLATTVMLELDGACTVTTLSGVALQSNAHSVPPLPPQCQPPCTLIPAGRVSLSTYVPAET
jgi:hypothetical protein